MQGKVQALLIRKNMRAGGTTHGPAQMIAGGNNCLLAADSEKAQHRFDLRPHVSRRKMPGFEVLLQFTCVDAIERPLRRLFEVQIHEIRISRDDKQIDKSNAVDSGTIVFVMLNMKV